MAASAGFREGTLGNARGFDEHFETLTPSQRVFVDLLREWSNSPRRVVIVVSGPPGSGKTHTVVKTIDFLSSRFGVIKMAPTAKIAQKIDGRTVHSTMNLAWDEGSVLRAVQEELKNTADQEECYEKSRPISKELTCYAKADVVIVDEVGMMPFWLLYRVIEYFFKRRNPVLVVCMGDSFQLRPVQSEYNVFQVHFKNMEVQHVAMRESKRFAPEYGPVVDAMRDFMTRSKEGEQQQEEQEKFFEFVRNAFPVVPILTLDILRSASRILCFTNASVEFYNDFYLTQVLKTGRVVRAYKLDGTKVDRTRFVQLKPNAMVICTENGCSQKARNGTSLKYLAYDPKLDAAVCENEFGAETLVFRSRYTGMIPLKLGFASTIHKFQGETIDDYNLCFNFDQSQDLNLIYTALSRVRNVDQILAIKL